MQQLKFSALAREGQTIRGYDFAPFMDPEGSSYVQGVVVQTHCMDRGTLDYKVRVTERKVGGVDQPGEVGIDGYIPHEVAMLEWDGRVKLVPEPA